MAVVFVTGANRGIGLALVKSYLSDGHTVYGSCRNPDGERALWEISSDFKNFHIVKLDVSSVDDHDVDDHLKAGQAIDLLINNAGVLLDPNAGIEALTIDQVAKSFDINCLGPMRVTRLLLPYLRNSDAAKIINISSAMGSILQNASGLCYAYRMSKAALNMFTKSLSIELDTITVASLHPGWVKTDMGGPNALIDTDASVSGLKKVIDQLKLRDSGGFLNFKGEVIDF